MFWRVYFCCLNFCNKCSWIARSWARCQVEIQIQKDQKESWLKTTAMFWRVYLKFETLETSAVKVTKDEQVVDLKVEKDQMSWFMIT